MTVTMKTPANSIDDAAIERMVEQKRASFLPIAQKSDVTLFV
ncbi:MAG: hypothetical protein ACTSV1_01440 [Alphaproteobacteria bacterium]